MILEGRLEAVGCPCLAMGDGALEVDRGSGGVGAEMGEGRAWAGTRGMEPSLPTALLAL